MHLRRLYFKAVCKLVHRSITDFVQTNWVTTGI